MKHHVYQGITFVLLFVLGITSCKKAADTVKTDQHRDREDIFASIVKGVNTLGSPQAIPGPIVPDSDWTIIAFCPAYNHYGVKNQPGIFAAARTYGDGRVFAMGHEGHFGPNLDKEDNQRFAKNVIQWLDIAGNRRICVRRTQWSFGIEGGLIQELKIAEYTIHLVVKEDELTEDDLMDCDVLVYSTRWNPITEKEIETVIGFIKNGGGALLTGLGWSYKGYVNQDLKEFPMNKIAMRLGLMFEDGFLYDFKQNYDNKPAHPVIHLLYPESPGPLVQP